MKTVTRTEMTYNEFEELVNSYFPKMNYSFVADIETHNDTSHAFDDINGEVQFWPTMMAVATGKRHEQFIARQLLNLFVNLGILPGGDYLIEVSW